MKHTEIEGGGGGWGEERFSRSNCLWMLIVILINQPLSEFKIKSSCCHHLIRSAA